MAARSIDVPDLPRQLAELVIRSRELLEATYDSVVRGLKAQNSEDTTELFKAAILGDDWVAPVDAKEAYARAFAAAARGGWLRVLVDRCLCKGIIDQRAAALMARPKPKAARKKKTDRRPPPPDLHTFLRQAAVNIPEGIDDPNAYIHGLQRTMPRICLVSVRGARKTQGTGFLVGPQAILTAWHVIEPLLDENGKPKKDSEKNIRVEFDYLERSSGGGGRTGIRAYRVLPDWLGEHSPCHNTEKHSKHGFCSKELSVGGIDEKYLDFAVIRLDGSPGRDRGIVTLRDESPRLYDGQPSRLLLFQHPNQLPQRLAPGLLTRFYGDGEPPPRLRHTANSGDGSSGGLCVDADFESIGMHQAAVLDADQKPVENQAVPTNLIMKQLNAAYTVNPMLDPLWRLRISQEPLIGREEFQKSVWRVVQGEKRIIAVRGKRRTGLTFSKYILRSLLPDNAAVIAEIAADEVGRDPIALATKMLARCGGVLPAGESFPDAAVAGTTPEAWLRDQLMPDLVKRIEAAALGKQVWIVLEHLDRHDIPEDQARQLLANLMIGTTPLRFLLLGPKSYLQGVPVASIEEDVTSGPEVESVDIYIQRRCTANNVTMAAEYRLHWAEAVIRSTQNTPDDPWPVALKFLIDHVHPITEARRK